MANIQEAMTSNPTAVTHGNLNLEVTDPSKVVGGGQRLVEPSSQPTVEPFTCPPDQAGTFVSCQKLRLGFTTSTMGRWLAETLGLPADEVKLGLVRRLCTRDPRS